MPMGVFIPVRTLLVCACGYIHSVGFFIAYSDYQVFSGPLPADKQEKEIRVFL